MTAYLPIRVNSIDMCRGLLFILMTNTHALRLIEFGPTHWTGSDLWLPNGWATIVFVVLSGYAAGYLLADRTPLRERDKRLRRRGLEILVVMFLTNAAFASLRAVSRGESPLLSQLDWYIGFFNLDTEWTISGVLLPTGLTLLIAPWVIQAYRKAPYWLLIGILLLQFGISLLRQFFLDLEVDNSWIVEFFLINGFGGFPVVPFLLNGCMGIWLGMTHRKYQGAWILLLGLLSIWQTILYFGMTLSPTFAWSMAMSTTGAVGKFACVFLGAIILVRILPRWLGTAVELMGRYALGSFVMHRVFLQALTILLGAALARYFDETAGYLFLFSATVFLTWLICWLRNEWPPIDYPFRILRI